MNAKKKAKSFGKMIRQFAEIEHVVIKVAFLVYPGIFQAQNRSDIFLWFRKQLQSPDDPWLSP